MNNIFDIYFTLADIKLIQRKFIQAQVNISHTYLYIEMSIEYLRLWINIYAY